MDNKQQPKKWIIILSGILGALFGLGTSFYIHPENITPYPALIFGAIGVGIVYATRGLTDEVITKNQNYISLVAIIVILLGILPFHYIFYDGSVKVFPKDNFTFKDTFVTESDIDKLIERHNNASFWDQTSIKGESLHKKI